MKPIKFKQSNVELSKPESMTDEECSPLPICRTEDGTCISCWKASFLDRVKFLFHGKIWLGVVSGITQPTVWLDCTNTVFTNQKP